MNTKVFKLVSVVLSLLGIVVTFGFEIYASGGVISNTFHSVSGVLVTLWPFVPYGILLCAASLFQSIHTRLTTMILAIMLVFFGIGIYADSLLVNLDPQGALNFLFVPIYQLGIIIVGYSIMASVAFVKTKKNEVSSQSARE